MKQLVAILLLALNLSIFGQETTQTQLQDKVQECIQNLPEEVKAQLKVIEQEMKQVQECNGDKKQELAKIAAQKQAQLKKQVQELPEGYVVIAQGVVVSILVLHSKIICRLPHQFLCPAGADQHEQQKDCGKKFKVDSHVITPFQNEHPDAEYPGTSVTRV